MKFNITDNLTDGQELEWPDLVKTTVKFLGGYIERAVEECRPLCEVQFGETSPKGSFTPCADEGLSEVCN